VTHWLPLGLSLHHRAVRLLGSFSGWLWESAAPKLIG
jgi:hypothetical protein